MLIDRFRSLEPFFVYNDISLNSNLFTYLYNDSLDNYAQQSSTYLHNLFFDCILLFSYVYYISISKYYIDQIYKKSRLFIMLISHWK